MKNISTYPIQKPLLIGSIIENNKNWSEDFFQENGNYSNICKNCFNELSLIKT